MAVMKYFRESDDVRDIVAGLTEPQRQFVLALPQCGAWHTWRGRVPTFGGNENALRGFGQSGLIEGYYREAVKHRLTPLGMKVRDELTVSA